MYGFEGHLDKKIEPIKAFQNLIFLNIDSLCNLTHEFLINQKTNYKLKSRKYMQKYLKNLTLKHLNTKRVDISCH